MRKMVIYKVTTKEDVKYMQLNPNVIQQELDFLKSIKVDVSARGTISVAVGSKEDREVRKWITLNT